MSLARHLTGLSKNLTSTAIAVDNNKIDSENSKAIKILFTVNISFKTLVISHISYLNAEKQLDYLRH